MMLFTKECYKVFGLALSILLLAGIAQGMVFTGEDDEGLMVISGEGHVSRLSPEGDKLVINNILEIKPFPTIEIGGNMIETPIPRYTKPEIGTKFENFEVKYPEAYLADVYASSRIILKDSEIDQELTIENTKDIEVLVKIKLSEQTDSFSIYAPFQKDRKKNYFYISPAERGMFGQMITAYYEPLPPSYPVVTESLSASASDFLIWAVKIPSKTKYSMKIIYLPTYLASSEEISKFPLKSVVDKQPFLISERDPLLDINNADSWAKLSAKPDTTKASIDVFDDIVSYTNDLGTSDPEFSLVSFFDWDVVSKKESFNSLEKSMIVRKNLRMVGIPARLIIGKKKGGEYYAWVEAYIGGITKVYDPFNQRLDYSVVYQEPSPMICKDNVKMCNFRGAISVGVVCVGPYCINIFFIIALLLLLVVSIFFVIVYKADILGRIISRKPTRELVLDGAYEIIDLEYKPEDPLLKEVLDYIRDKKGMVKVDEASIKLGYSKIVIKSALEWLLEKGVISKS